MRLKSNTEQDEAVEPSQEQWRGKQVSDAGTIQQAPSSWGGWNEPALAAEAVKDMAGAW